MSKEKLFYVCQGCGAELTKWAGCCPQCKQWNQIVEQIADSQKLGYSGSHSAITTLAHIKSKNVPRQSTGLTEFDHVLGGGILPGLVVLLGGDPGIGKSTILFQALGHLAVDYTTLYVTGEESLQQLAIRARRLNCPIEQMFVLAETCVERIIEHMQAHKPQVVVIDSMQTTYTDLLSSAPGSVGQVRESAAKLIQYAKRCEISIFLVGHVTKEGMLAGPKVLEHMVDTVLYFEGDNNGRFRMIRSVKNRYGSINELGVFAMTESGLKAVQNPSAIFLSSQRQETPGNMVTVIWEGSRPLLLEVQALVDQSYLANPRRLSIGIDQQRLAMLLAVLSKHAKVQIFDKDVFVNVVGGLKCAETAPDLAILLAIYSSLLNQVWSNELLVFGEIGLTGEIRPVPFGLERLQEASKHGFKQVLFPKANQPKRSTLPIKQFPVTCLQDAFAAIEQLKH